MFNASFSNCPHACSKSALRLYSQIREMPLINDSSFAYLAYSKEFISIHLLKLGNSKASILNFLYRLLRSPLICPNRHRIIYTPTDMVWELSFKRPLSMILQFVLYPYLNLIFIVQTIAF